MTGSITSLVSAVILQYLDLLDPYILAVVLCVKYPPSFYAKLQDCLKYFTEKCRGGETPYARSPKTLHQEMLLKFRFLNFYLQCP